MTPNTTGHGSWSATIRAEGERLAALPAESLDATVPTLPDWTVERVVRHVGKVHRWVTGLLAAPVDADPSQVARAAPSLPRGAACLTTYREALDEMLAAFAAADPARPVPSFIGPADVAFWARRQAHEVAVHRVDAQDAIHTAGGPVPDPLDPVAAVDGVAEWIEVFAASHRSPDGSDDDTAASVVEFVPAEVVPAARLRVRYHPGAARPVVPVDPEVDGDADVVVTGPAGALLLTVWRRRPLDGLRVTGDPTHVAAMLDTVRV